MRLVDVMTTDVCTTASGTAVSDAAAAMVKGRFGSVVVLEGPLLVGIFTERDVLRAASSGVDLTHSPVSRWMSRDPETVEPGADTEDAAEIMLGNGFRHLPVVEANALVGIVSLRDVLSARIRRRPA
jgi:CBS domain-containing protein